MIELDVLFRQNVESEKAKYCCEKQQQKDIGENEKMNCSLEAYNLKNEIFEIEFHFDATVILPKNNHKNAGN